MQRWPAAPNAEPMIPSTVLSIDGVGHHDHVVLGAAERLDALAGPRRALVDDPRDRAPSRRTRPRRCRGASRIPSTTSRPPLTRFTTPGGQVERVELLEGDLLRQRDLLGGLEHERVAARDRERQEPERHHRREVERHDRGAHADRLADRLGVDVARDVLEDRGPASSSGSRRRTRPSRSCARPRRARRRSSCPSRSSPSAPGPPGAATSRSRSSNSLRARAIVDDRRATAGSAARAAATAASRSADPDSGTRASTSPVAGLVTSSSSVAPVAGVHWPAM